MVKVPYFFTDLSFYSDKDIHEAAKMISNQLFGGLPFGGLKDYIYEEVPAIYIDDPILGFDVITQGYGGEKLYFLDINNHPNIQSAIIDSYKAEIHSGELEIENIDITGFVETLLEGTKGIEIGHKKVLNEGYINISESPDVNSKLKNKFPYFICHLPFNSDKDIHEVGKIISGELCGGLPFETLENDKGPAVQLDRTILGLNVKIVQDEKGYCLEIRNHPDMIPDGVDTVNIDITRFIALSLVETEEINMDFNSINKELVKIG